MLAVCKTFYSGIMAIAVKKAGLKDPGAAMEFMKKKFPGQPEDRYGRAIEKAGLKAGVPAASKPKAESHFMKTEKILKTDAITSTKALGGGVTETFACGVDGIKGVFKKMTNRAKQEVTAYELDKMLGFGIVPPVVYRDVDVGAGIEKGSMMHFVEGKVAAAHTGKFKYSDMAKITAFDFIIGNQDRHPANIIVDPSGRSWAIDNAFAFGKAKNIVSATIPMVQDKPIPGFVKAGIMRLTGNRTALEPKIAQMLGSKEYAKALFDRAGELLKMKDFPKERYTWHKTWTAKHGYTPEKVRGLAEGLGWLTRLFSTSTTSSGTRMQPLDL